MTYTIESHTMSPTTTPILASERLVMATVAVTHGRVADMRSQAFVFEKILGEHYLPANVLPIPDSVEGPFPRITYASKHGYSQISCALNSITLNVQFSPDWQIEHPKSFEYVTERISLVERMLALLPEAKPRFSGIILMLNMPSLAGENEITGHLHRSLRLPASQAGAYELEVKTVRVVDDRFFQTTVVRNYRAFQQTTDDGSIPRMSASKASERGVQIAIDFNDRHSYNERNGYVSSEADRREMISKAMLALTTACQELRG